MSDQKVDNTRRNLLVATSIVGGAAGAAAAVPFAASWIPSERAKAAGAPVEVDISKMAPGELQVVEWRGKPVWILKRTKEMLDSLKAVASKLQDPSSSSSSQPEYAAGDARARKAEIMVMEGVCTHLGCKFDYAGRVFKGAPAPLNLPVPPHTYLSDTTILIGEDKKGA